MDDYIPEADAPALLWMRGFVDNIAEKPSAYQMSASDVSTLLSAVDNYQRCLMKATNFKTRGTISIEEKNSARNAAETLCRQYAVLIKHNNGISDSSKLEIGVRPVNPYKTPIECPKSSPTLTIVAATPGAHTLRYADSLTPNNRRKPFGAAALRLWVHIGDEKTTDVSLARFHADYTTTPFTVNFEHEDDRKCATYFAQWSGRRGDTGNWSTPVSMTIAA